MVNAYINMYTYIVLFFLVGFKRAHSDISETVSNVYDQPYLNYTSSKQEASLIPSAAQPQQ